MYDALYARQSVEKVDSISIESQLEYCRHEARGNPCREYIDRGVQRQKHQPPPPSSSCWPTSARGRVARVIVYKLDRISRSILDFANMMQLFQQHRVEFVSSTERFDTSTPIGRAMLHICIVFAQLERGDHPEAGSPTPTTPAAKRGCTWAGRGCRTALHGNRRCWMGSGPRCLSRCRRRPGRSS